MSAALGEKLGLPLSDHPTMITVRGLARATDGKIHTDSGGKLATVLLYINDGWNAEGGRLRLLRSAGDLDDYAKWLAALPPPSADLP